MKEIRFAIYEYLELQPQLFDVGISINIFIYIRVLHSPSHSPNGIFPSAIVIPFQSLSSGQHHHRHHHHPRTGATCSAFMGLRQTNFATRTITFTITRRMVNCYTDPRQSPLPSAIKMITTRLCVAKLTMCI